MNQPNEMTNTVHCLKWLWEVSRTESAESVITKRLCGIPTHRHILDVLKHSEKIVDYEYEELICDGRFAIFIVTYCPATIRELLKAAGKEV